MDESEKRKKSIEELQKLMQEQRDRIDPAILKRAENAARQSQQAKPAITPAAEPENLPYDRENAAKAIELFLKGHSNSRDFQMKLLENLKKKDH